MTLANPNNHLQEVARLAVKGDQFVFDRQVLWVAARHSGAPYQLTAVSLENPTAPRILGRSEFKNQLQALTLVNDTLYLSESHRALHLVDVTKPTQPVPLDCLLMFRQEIYEFGAVGGRFLVAARNWEGVSVFDLKEPYAPRLTDTKKLGESYVEHLVVVGSRIFAAAHADGLVELAITADGKLDEVARYYGEGDFDVGQVLWAGDRLWCFGEGVIPEPEEETEDDDDAGDDDEEEEEEEQEEPDTLLLSLSQLDAPLWRGKCGQKPDRARALVDGSLITLDGYKCFHLVKGAKAKLLFARFETDLDAADPQSRHAYVEQRPGEEDESERPTSCMDDACCWARKGEFLFVKQVNDLIVYRIADHSPLRQMAEG